MSTGMYRLLPGQSISTGELVDLPRTPSYQDLDRLLRPIIGDPWERVAVRFGGEPCDMFVHEYSAMEPRHPRNESATAIYRAATLAREPQRDPESLPAIYGIAVLFNRRVWF